MGVDREVSGKGCGGRGGLVGVEVMGLAGCLIVYI
jgi:hypothetical protein